jgi:DNA-binding NarL/FixJ family response regulator
MLCATNQGVVLFSSQILAASRVWPGGPACDGNAMTVRCLVVDDNRDFLQAARKILESGGITVVGAASSSAEALLQAKESNPDIVLVDIVLGSESGFDLARKLTATTGPPRAVILISTHGEEDFSDLIAASPAIGFLPKWKLSARAIENLLRERGDGLDC